jgi:hypothetical protein
MRLVAAVLMVALLLVPGVALAGSEDAALALGAFAVFNQIISGTGIFAPASAVVVPAPAYVAPRPVFAPPPVYVAPAPVYAPPVIVAPRPVVIAPRPVVVYRAPAYVYHRAELHPGHGHGRWHGHSWHGHR